MVDLVWIVQGLIIVLLTVLGFVGQSLYKNIIDKLNTIIKLQIDNEVLKTQIANILEDVHTHEERIAILESVVNKIKT